MSRRTRDFLRYAYPVTAMYLSVMVTLTVILLAVDSSLACHC